MRHAIIALTFLLSAFSFQLSAAPQPLTGPSVKLTAPAVQSTASAIERLLILDATGLGQTATPAKLWDAIVLTGGVDTADITGLSAALAAKAPLASPALTGTATAANLTVSGILDTGASGSILTENFQIRSTLDDWTATFNADALTGNRILTIADNDGTLATREWAANEYVSGTATRASNTFLAGPADASTQSADFRRIAPDDLSPDNYGTASATGLLHGNMTWSPASLTADVTGTLPAANGGTGQTSYTNGQLLIGNTTGNTLTKSTLTAGSGITITNGTGSITIAATGGITGTGSVDNAVLRADGTGGATLQSSDLIIEDATVSTANNVCLTNVHAGQTNSSLVLAPKGTGALILGPKPDGTSTGGNARGANAVDLQPGNRSAAAQVASGAQSVAVGTRNTASGAQSVAIGYQSTASNTISVAIGYLANASAAGAVAIGGGGPAVTASGNYSLSTGYDNTASGQQSVALGGGSNVSSGSHSAALGGSSNTSSSQYSTASGFYAVANRIGQKTAASGRFAASGDAQASELVLRRSTTDATQTEMTIDGATASGTAITTSNRVIMNASSTIMVDVRFVARSTSGTDNACYQRRCLIKRDGANNTALVGTVQNVGTDIESAAGWDVTLQADDTNESLQIMVTGAAATTIRWVAEVRLVEVSF